MKRQWSEVELDVHWTLTTAEEALLVGRAGHGRFGFLVLLKFFQYEGRFPKSRREVPVDVMRHLATGLGMSLNTLDDFKWDGRTAKRQRTEILEWPGIRRMEKGDWENLSTWLDSEILPADPMIEQLTERTVEWLRTQRLDPLGPTSLEKLLRTQTHAFESNLLIDIEGHLTEASRRALDNLLETFEGANPEAIATRGLEPIAKFSHLRGDAGRVSLDTLLQELGKLKLVRELALPSATMAALPKKWLKKFRQRACIETIWDLRRHPGITRHGLMAAFCHERQHEIIDGLIDLLMQITHKALSKAEKKVEQQLLADFQRVRGKTTVLFRRAIPKSCV